MSYQPHYIASFDDDSGLNTYSEPFITPEKAFPVLEDAYCWRNRVVKKSGYSLLGRLRRSLKLIKIADFSSAGAGYVSINLFTALGLLATEPNAQLEIANATDPLTIVIAAPIGQTITDTLGTGVLDVTLGGPIDTATIVYSTGVLTLHYTAASAASVTTVSCAYYPGLPVMGLRTQEIAPINSENYIQFDTKYAYKYDFLIKKFIELPSAAATTWNGLDSNFFWTTNYYKDVKGTLFWATNTYMTGARDPIRYYNTNTWTNFAPLVTGVDTLYNAEIIIPYKNRLLFLNTWEGSTVGGLGGAINYENRVRWSWIGDPTNVDAFRSDKVGKGGVLDVATNEVIVSVEFIKDTLIVKFERSSWKIVYTGNPILPFVFQKINTELGSESKFSLVPFDNGVFSVGNYGITTDDSINVQRIDVKIPNVVFGFQNAEDGPARVHGIRDYYNELVYWTYANSSDRLTFPNRVLCLNYINNTFAIFKDSFTCFGNFQQTLEQTWAELNTFTWDQWDEPWNTAKNQPLFPSVIAGTQHGFVEICLDKVKNADSLYIKAIDFAATVPVFTLPDHNLQTGNIIQINGTIINGLLDPLGLNGLGYIVDKIDNDKISVKYYQVSSNSSNPVFWDLKAYYKDEFGVMDVCQKVDAASTYVGNGTVAKINNFKISTKRFSPFYEHGSQCRLGYVDFLCDRTGDGKVNVDIYIDEDSSTSMTDSETNTALLGDNVLDTGPENLSLIPFQATQDKIFHRKYIHAIAQNVQITISMSPELNADLPNADQSFGLHAIVLYLSPNARLIQ